MQRDKVFLSLSLSLSLSPLPMLIWENAVILPLSQKYTPVSCARARVCDEYKFHEGYRYKINTG
jgi:hypothetical protein